MQVEVGMISRQKNGCLVSRRMVVNVQAVAVGQRVGHGYAQRTGEPVLTVRENGRKNHTDGIFGFGCFGLPERAVEGIFPAVERVAVIVLSRLVDDTVQLKLPAGDTSCVAADGCTEIGVVGRLDVFVKCLKAQDDVFAAVVFIRGDEFDQRCTVIHQSGFNAVVVA